MITDAARQDEVLARLADADRDVIRLTEDHIAHFAGNAIELLGDKGLVLALSRTAFEAMDGDQRVRIEASAALLPLDIPTIERAGSSVGCKLAGVHLAPRQAS